jgi:hypothetical protein
MKPVSLILARKNAVIFMEGRLQGSRNSIARQVKECLRILLPIHTRFGVDIFHLQRKHLRWFLAEYDKNHAAKTRNNHWYSVLRIVEALAKEDDWKPLLANGPWIRKDGDTNTLVEKRRPSKKATPSRPKPKVRR